MKQRLTLGNKIIRNRMEGFCSFLSKASISKIFRYHFDIVDWRLEDWKLEGCETPRMMSKKLLLTSWASTTALAFGLQQV
jgi:hypothetical protein